MFSFSVIDDVAVAAIAQQCHEANRVYCQSIGDDSQVAWSDAADWQKNSAIAGVRNTIFNKATAEQNHASWRALKQSEGWVYGAAKDPVAKTHPCMMPYDQLPDEQKIKDHIFRAVCLSFVNAFYTGGQLA